MKSSWKSPRAEPMGDYTPALLTRQVLRASLDVNL